MGNRGSKYLAGSILLAMSLIIFLLYQFMAFFVALNGGYDTRDAFVFAVVPLLGPLFCCFQLMLAGAGWPAILLLLFASGSVTALGWAYFRDRYKKGGQAAELRPDDQDVPLTKPHVLGPQSLPDIVCSPKPQPIPENMPFPKPQPMPENMPAPKPVRLPETSPKPKAAPAVNQNNITRELKSENVKPPQTAGKTDADLTEKYGEVLKDVLSILNKY